MTGRARGGGGSENARAPDPRLDLDLVACPANHVEPVRLAEPVRTRPAKAGRGRENERRAAVVAVASNACRSTAVLWWMWPPTTSSAPRGGEGLQRRVAVLERELARGAPRCSGEMVVADDDAEGVGGCACEDRRDGVDARRRERAALVAPGAGGVQSAGDGVFGLDHGLGGAEDRLEQLPGCVARAGSV